MWLHTLLKLWQSKIKVCVLDGYLDHGVRPCRVYSVKTQLRDKSSEEIVNLYRAHCLYYCDMSCCQLVFISVNTCSVAKYSQFHIITYHAGKACLQDQ